MNRQLPLSLPHDEAMGADDFHITASNREAAAWLSAWPDWPTHGLIVTGPQGSGKTHLLNLWRTKSAGRLMRVEELVSGAAIDAGAALAIDEADSVAGNAALEEALFHLYNRVQAAHGSLMLAMRDAAGRTGFQLPDLRSRLLTLPVAALGAPDDELIAALIVKQFRDRQVTLSAGVVDYLVPRVERSAAGIRDLVEKLDRASLAENRRITTALARRILDEAP